MGIDRGRPISSIYGKLVKISISGIKASGIVESDREKWGKPHRREIVPLQNTYGAKVDGGKEVWYIGNNVVSLVKIPERIDDVYYVYGSLLIVYPLFV